MSSNSILKEEGSTGDIAPALRTRSVSVASSSSKGSPSKKKKCISLPPETVDYLKAWMMSPEHISHPYPTEQEKAKIMADTGIEMKQLTNWFVNNRKRYWKPRVEARLREQSLASSPTGQVVLEPKLSQSTIPKTAPVEDVTIGKVVSTGNLIALQKTDSAPMTSSTSSSSSSSSSSSVTTINRLPTPSTRPLQSPAQLVSEQSSVVSETASVSCSDSEEEEWTAESVDVHILRPVVHGTPSLEDVSILPNIPPERILKTYSNCAINYKSTFQNSRKKSCSRRDAEIVRIKKHYLQLYLAECGPTLLPVPPKRTRCEFEEVEEPETPRPKFRRVSVDLWKRACEVAPSTYDPSLPSLEEATQLFGYAG